MLEQRLGHAGPPRFRLGQGYKPGGPLITKTTSALAERRGVDPPGPGRAPIHRLEQTALGRPLHRIPPTGGLRLLLNLSAPVNYLAPLFQKFIANKEFRPGCGGCRRHGPRLAASQPSGPGQPVVQKMAEQRLLVCEHSRGDMTMHSQGAVDGNISRAGGTASTRISRRIRGGWWISGRNASLTKSGFSIAAQSTETGPGTSLS